MAEVNLSILKITGDDNTYIITDTEAQTLAQSAQSTAQSAQSTAQSAQSTAQSAQSTADGKLKRVTLQSNYEEETKTLTVSLNTSIN